MLIGAGQLSSVYKMIRIGVFANRTHWNPAIQLAFGFDLPHLEINVKQMPTKQNAKPVFHVISML